MRFTDFNDTPTKLLINASLGLMLIMPAVVIANTILRMQTDLGAIDIELFDTAAPFTVENFLNYVNDGDYDGTFIHRLAKVETAGVGVLQMGGYIMDSDDANLLLNEVSHIPTDESVVNEPDPVNRPNQRGTLAMAKSADPDSATSEWYFNLIDNLSLDDPVNSGGFTVFGQVMGNGMDIIDKISLLSRCIDFAPFPILCGSFTEVPVISDKEIPSNRTLINIISIGSDNDGDGAIDRLEDAGPNSGDGNNDAILDSTQQHVASFPDGKGGYVILESAESIPMQSLDVLGVTFALANPPDPADLLDGLDFKQGYFGFELLNVTAGGSVTVTLPEGEEADIFFNFGPTPDNAIPHWYEFIFDGETGAQINGNEITLHFVDGKRGDSDLVVNGIISKTPGGPAHAPGDDDGIPDDVEDTAPNNGDGNKDEIQDSKQDNVASFTDINNSYITIATNPALSLGSVDVHDATFLNNTVPANSMAGLNFLHGFLEFEVSNAASGAAVSVTVILPEGETPVTYFKYGPTPGNPDPHWYEFLYDGETGAEIKDNVITLHFVDGKRGDSDLDATNGVISDPGGPAVNAPVTGAADSGGGCSLGGGDARPARAGAWVLLVLMLVLIGGRRACAKVMR